MLQEQHNKQMDTIAATNKANMDAMMECMNALVVAAGGKRSNNKKNTPPTGNNTNDKMQEEIVSQLQDVCVPQPGQML